MALTSTPISFASPDTTGNQGYRPAPIAGIFTATTSIPLVVAGLHTGITGTEADTLWYQFADNFAALGQPFAVVLMNYGSTPGIPNGPAWAAPGGVTQSNELNYLQGVTGPNFGKYNAGTGTAVATSIGIPGWAAALHADKDRVMGVGYSASASFWLRFLWHNTGNPTQFTVRALMPTHTSVWNSTNYNSPGGINPPSWTGSMPLFTMVGTSDGNNPWNGGLDSSGGDHLALKTWVEEIGLLNGWDGVSPTLVEWGIKNPSTGIAYTRKADYSLHTPLGATRYYLITAGNAAIAPWKNGSPGELGGTHQWTNTWGAFGAGTTHPADLSFDATQEAASWFMNQVLSATPPPPAPSGLPARIATAGLAAAAANTYYVDAASGNDSTGTGSAAAPWKTVQKALDSGLPIPAAASNTPIQLYVYGTKTGTTRGFTITDDGPGSVVPAGYSSASAYQPARTLNYPADSPLLISNFPGERVLLGFGIHHNLADTYVCWRASPVGGKRGIVIDSHFPAGATTVPGFATVGCHNIELYGCEVRNNSSVAGGVFGGIYVGAFGGGGPATNIQIINCFVHHNGGTSTSCHGIYWGGTTGTEQTGAVGGAVYNCVIVFNYVDNLCPHNMSNGAVFANNVLAGWGGVNAAGTVITGGTGLPVQSYTDGVTFFAAPSGLQSLGNVVVNNIMACNSSYGLNQFDAASGGGNVEKSNIYFGNGTGAIRDASAAGNWSKTSTLLNNDPLFVSFSPSDPASDFHLKGASPAVAAGDPAFCPLFDYDDNLRSGTDIGPMSVTVGPYGTLVESNNLFWGFQNFRFDGNNYTTLAQYVAANSLGGGSVSKGAGDIVADPKLSAAPELLPVVGSPVVDVGIGDPDPSSITYVPV